MKRKLTVLSIGVVTFVLVTASAASLGSGVTSKSLSAGTAGVSGCGDPGAISVSYVTIVESNVTKVDQVVLTADNTTNSNPWTYATAPRSSCVGKAATITLGSQTPEVVTVPSPTGTYNEVLTFDLQTNISVNNVSNFSIVIQG